MMPCDLEMRVRSLSFLFILMIILSWNVIGASGRDFARAFRDTIFVNKADLVAIQEPR